MDEDEFDYWYDDDFYASDVDLVDVDYYDPFEGVDDDG